MARFATFLALKIFSIKLRLRANSILLHSAHCCPLNTLPLLARCVPPPLSRHLACVRLRSTMSTLHGGTSATKGTISLPLELWDGVDPPPHLYSAPLDQDPGAQRALSLRGD